MALVFRKVELRTTDRFKCIISQLMMEIESLAKSIFEELGTITLGELISFCILSIWEKPSLVHWCLCAFSLVQTMSRL